MRAVEIYNIKLYSTYHVGGFQNDLKCMQTVLPSFRLALYYYTQL